MFGMPLAFTIYLSDIKKKIGLNKSPSVGGLAGTRLGMFFFFIIWLLFYILVVPILFIIWVARTLKKK